MTSTSTGRRLAAWGRRNAVLLLATVAVVALGGFLLASTLQLAEERRARLEVIEQLTLDQCEGINGTNATVRFVLGAGLRLRSPDNPVSPELREAYEDAYRRLPHTDCTTGAETYSDPPFPQGENP